MHLARLLSCEQIIPSLTATEHWEAIVELVERLVACGKVCPEDKDEVIRGLRAREESMSTGIGYGVAIPHTVSSRAKEVIVAFGRAPKGIEFDSLDARPVRFIVLFIVPAEKYHLHLRTLAAIAKFLNEPGISDRLALAADAREIYTIFQSTAVRHHGQDV